MCESQKEAIAKWKQQHSQYIQKWNKFDARFY